MAPNQNTESAILSNEKGSQGYYSFVESLGWTVDLATHCGYRAKLEFDGTNGEFANYYSTESLELMFHDITRMPNDPSDEKRVKKVIFRLSDGKVKWRGLETTCWKRSSARSLE